MDVCFESNNSELGPPISIEFLHAGASLCLCALGDLITICYGKGMDPGGVFPKRGPDLT